MSFNIPRSMLKIIQTIKLRSFIINETFVILDGGAHGLGGAGHVEGDWPASAASRIDGEVAEALLEAGRHVAEESLFGDDHRLKAGLGSVGLKGGVVDFVFGAAVEAALLLLL
jgi:tetrahydromethanopterin S-methyltransferase subunit F